MDRLSWLRTWLWRRRWWVRFDAWMNYSPWPTPGQANAYYRRLERELFTADPAVLAQLEAERRAQERRERGPLPGDPPAEEPNA